MLFKCLFTFAGTLALGVLASCLPARRASAIQSQGGCITDSARVQMPLWRGKRMAGETSVLGLPPFDSSSVTLVTSASVCRAAGIAGFGDSAAPDSLVLIALGESGYLAHGPTVTLPAGEFNCELAVLDKQLRRKSLLCG